jgi:FMN reductase
MSRYKVVAVAGNLGAPSRTRVLVDQIVTSIQGLADVDASTLELAQVGPQLGQALFRKQLSPEVEALIARVESADLLVVASPVYRASYPGLFKHLFDLVSQDALVGVPVVLAATGGSERHSLVLEHALRPLFSFFRAHTVPTSIYATEADFDGYRLRNEVLLQRIEQVAEQAISLLWPRHGLAKHLRGIA